ncbi:MAG: hypothetical protein LBR90_00935, partial [Elusimicrobiota bacterium]|nr:hypothetical protein [Elusimicrobiota bacterium]
MKSIKLFLTCALCAAAFAACAGKQKAPEAFDKTKSAVIKLLNKANACKTDDDCRAVFADCCGTASQPYFVNKKHAESFGKKYRKLHKQNPCPQAMRCSRAYFGNLTDAQC